jgi:hypothetical protein
MSGHTVTKTITKEKNNNNNNKRRTVTLKLRPRHPHPYRDKIWQLDWIGFEKQREQVRKLALRIKEDTQEFEKECVSKGWQACGALGCAIRNPEEAERIFSPSASRVGRLYLALRELNTSLIYTHGLYCDLVLKESDMVLSTDREQIWNGLIEKQRRKQQRLSRTTVQIVQ